MCKSKKDPWCKPWYPGARTKCQTMDYVVGPEDGEKYCGKSTTPLNDTLWRKVKLGIKIYNVTSILLIVFIALYYERIKAMYFYKHFRFKASKLFF